MTRPVSGNGTAPRLTRQAKEGNASKLQSRGKGKNQHGEHQLRELSREN